VRGGRQRPLTVGRGRRHCRANRVGGGGGRRSASGGRAGSSEMGDPVSVTGRGRERLGGDGAPTGGPGQHSAGAAVQTVF
jgi:hypothetical protein